MADQRQGGWQRRWLQWRQQNAGPGQFGGGGQRFGRFGQGGPGRFGGGGQGFGRFGQGGPGRFGGGGQEFGQGDQDIVSMTSDQQANHLQRLKFRLDWLQQQLDQTQEQIRKIEALETVPTEFEESTQDIETEASGDLAQSEGLESRAIEPIAG